MRPAYTDLITFYEMAKKLCVENGFKAEIEIVRSRRFAFADEEDFLHQYIYVVLNAGISNKAAESMYHDFTDRGIEAINHDGKRTSIGLALIKYKEWFETLQKKKPEHRLPYLETLPWIGKITKYHLARNLGIDVAKPDRHLLRVAEKFGYTDIQEMCRQVSKRTGDRIGVVDVVIWRACEQGIMKGAAH